MTPVGTIGRYEVLGRLAVGGMAEVYLAREQGPASASRELVVKRVLSHVAEEERHRDAFVQEARLTMRLRHPNICAIYEFGEDGGDFYLAMEWVHGVSLRKLWEAANDHGGLPVDVVCHVFADIASALHHAHTATDQSGQPLGIIHRDVTPDNLIVGFDGAVKLIDFGVAKASIQKHQTQQGELKGKFAYMSPEQYQSEPLDLRSDLFSLGVCLYEALSGEPLFERGDELQTVAAVLFAEEVPSIRERRPEVPERLDRLVTSMLARDREARVGSADAVERELRELLAEHGAAVRDADVAALLERLFPGQRAAGPRLDRSPLRKSAPESSVDPLTRAVLGAEVDELEDEFNRSRSRKRLALGFVGAAVVLGLLGGLGWVLSQAPPPSTPEVRVGGGEPPGEP